MTFFRLPLVAWQQVTAATLFLLSVRPLIAGAVMLLLDRVLGAAFYDPQLGGDPLLWQHLLPLLVLRPPRGLRGPAPRTRLRPRGPARLLAQARRARCRLRALRADQRRPGGQRRRAADVPLSPRHPLLYVAFEVFIFAVVLVLARWVFDDLAGWAVVVGSLLAATGMLTYYFTAHPRLVGQVRAALADEG